MFRLLFTDIAHAGSCFSGEAARRPVTRAASLAAITVLTLGTLSGAAVAQVVRDHRTPTVVRDHRTPTGGPFGGSGTIDPGHTGGNANTTPLRVYFTALYCADESNDNTWPNPDHDEPYVVIFSADLRNGGAQGRVFVSQEFSDVDNGETRNDMLPMWDLNGNGAPMGSNDYIFLAALMECDNSSNRDAVRNKLSSVLIPKLASYKAAGMSRSAMTGNLRIDMDLALETARATYQDEDDRVGGITEVFFTDAQLDRARGGVAAYEYREFVGSDSRYTLTFRLQ